MANFLVDPALRSDARHDARAVNIRQRLRVVRHGRQRLGVGARLVRRVVLRDVAANETRPGPRTDRMRLVRGGGWLVADVRMLSCSHRHKVPPDTYSYAIGFRVACVRHVSIERIDHDSMRAVPVAAIGVAGGRRLRCRAEPVPQPRDSDRVRRDHDRRRARSKAPDRAWVTIAAESRARTAPEAQRANTEAMTAVNAKIKASGIPADAIQTTGYNLQPEFDYANGRQTLRGYVARNQVQVRVDALAKLGDIIRRGGLDRRDQRRRHPLRPAGSRHRRARGAAAGGGRRARARRRGRLGRGHEGGPRTADRGAARLGSADAPASPMPMMRRASRSRALPVPIESGEIEVRARVTLTAAIK